MAPILGGAQDTPPHSPAGVAGNPAEGMYNPAEVPPQQVYRASQGMYNSQPLPSGAPYAQSPLQNATRAAKVKMQINNMLPPKPTFHPAA